MPPSPELPASEPQSDLLKARLDLWEHERTIALQGIASQATGVISLLVFAGLTGGYFLSMGPLTHDSPETAAISSSFVLLMGVFFAWLGTGLRRFEPNRRLGAIVFSCFEMLLFPVGTIRGYEHLKLLLSAEGKRLLSREHQAVIRATPQIRTFQEITPDKRLRIVAIVIVAILILALVQISLLK